MQGGEVFALIEKVVDEVGVRRQGVGENGVEDLQSHPNDLLQQGKVLQLKQHISGDSTKARRLRIGLISKRGFHHMKKRKSYTKQLALALSRARWINE